MGRLHKWLWLRGFRPLGTQEACAGGAAGHVRCGAGGGAAPNFFRARRRLSTGRYGARRYCCRSPPRAPGASSVGTKLPVPTLRGLPAPEGAAGRVSPAVSLRTSFGNHGTATAELRELRRLACVGLPAGSSARGAAEDVGGLQAIPGLSVPSGFRRSQPLSAMKNTSGPTTTACVGSVSSGVPDSIARQPVMRVSAVVHPQLDHALGRHAVLHGDQRVPHAHQPVDAAHGPVGNPPPPSTHLAACPLERDEAADVVRRQHAPVRRHGQPLRRDEVPGREASIPACRRGGCGRRSRVRVAHVHVSVGRERHVAARCRPPCGDVLRRRGRRCPSRTPARRAAAVRRLVRRRRASPPSSPTGCAWPFHRQREHGPLTVRAPRQAPRFRRTRPSAQRKF